MTRRLVAVVVGLTVLVVVGFAIPLAVVVGNIQRDDGIDAAVAAGSSLAAFIDNDTTEAEIVRVIDRLAVENPDYDVTVYSRDGARIGAAAPRDELVDLAFDGRETTVNVDGGLVDYAPNNGPFAGPSRYALRLEAPATSIEPDLGSFYLALGLSALFALALAAAVAGLAARSIATPTRRLTEAARQLQRGDFNAEVPEGGPPEVRELARTLALLSAKIRELLDIERESAADLAHRLRTPLTALVLEVEALPDSPEREQLLDRVGRTERDLNEVIAELRRPPAGADLARTDISKVVRDRLTDWDEPAIEKRHRLVAGIHADGPRLVAGSPADIEAAVDVLMDNAITHTPSGSVIEVTLADAGSDSVRLSVQDDGPGFPPGAIEARGFSGGASSGLGLDIARRTAERSGGSLRLATPPGGGARVELTFKRIRG